MERKIIMKRNILLFFLCASSLALTGCSIAAKANDTHDEYGKQIVGENWADDGYYLSDCDDSYIHVENGKIEMCGYDYVQHFTEEWNEYDGKKVELEEYLANCEESYLRQSELQEYTPVKFIGMGDVEGEDYVMLVLDYDRADAIGAYTGYSLDGHTITVGDSFPIYTYFGTKLPE